MIASVFYAALFSLLFRPADPGMSRNLSAMPVVSADQGTLTEDTLVNYCRLIRAAFFYGQKFADKKLGLTAEDVDYFNHLWSGVFSDSLFQTGITTMEFIMGARFGEGNQVPFPSSVRYYQENPDTYLLFHLVKEIGMIHSKTFETCPSCIELSIAKINAYLKTMYLYSQLAQSWENMPKRFTTAQEAQELWATVLLHCMFQDRSSNPTQKQDKDQYLHCCKWDN